MKNNSIFLRVRHRGVTLLLSFILILCNGCDQLENDLAPYDPGTPPAKIGSYLITEDNGITESNYELGLHWNKGLEENEIELCNFSNRKIKVIVYIHDGNTISIPQQEFESDFSNFQILQGSGTLTSDGFILQYWAAEGKENFSAELIAKRIE
jgi:hypothetical protein